MINRCHIDAKGEVEGITLEDDYEPEEQNDKENDERKDQANKTLIAELINYIQKEAKSFRHGIPYAQLRNVTAGVFKRPKVWSSTRMVVYEFEMLEIFLENSVFLDIRKKY